MLPSVLPGVHFPALTLLQPLSPPTHKVSLVPNCPGCVFCSYAKAYPLNLTTPKLPRKGLPLLCFFRAPAVELQQKSVTGTHTKLALALSPVFKWKALFSSILRQRNSHFLCIHILVVLLVRPHLKKHAPSLDMASTRLCCATN